MGYIYARLIHDGNKKLSDVPERFLQATKDAYLELFGESLEASLGNAKEETVKTKRIRKRK